MSACELCDSTGGELVWQDDQCRVVRVGGTEGADYPGYCRVIWREHVREMSDLAGVERRHLMQVTFATELAVRALYQPDKINLASLGNLTPHLHWHVIPRWRDDRNFPAPIWAAAQRSAAPTTQHLGMTKITDITVQTLHDYLRAALAEAQKDAL